MTLRPLGGALLAAACLALPGAVLAHVTLERTTITPNSTYRGTLQVNHGCRGAATTAISVSVPNGIIALRPMPKAGWSLAIRKAPYAKPYRLYGETLTEGAKEVTWSGGIIPDDQYDEFVFVARVTEDFKPGATIHVPVVQTCGATASNWIEEPAAGQAAADLRSPAPAIRVVDGTETARAESEPAHDMSTMGGPSPAAGGTSYRLGALTIEAPWIRATPAGAKVAGGYVRVTNGGTEPDRLVSTSIPLAGHGEIHEMRMDGDVMKMRPVDGGIEIRPGETIVLKPGGFHLMFMDLQAGPKEGETVRGSLTFAKAGTVEVTFRVAGLGAQSAPASPSR